MAILLPVVLAVALAPQATTVTYRTRGATVGQVLTDLSQRTGTRLEATPATSREIVLVDVHDAKLEDLLAHVAEVADGELKREGDGFRIVRSDAFARKSRAAEIERSAQQMAAEFERRRKELAAFGPEQAESLAERVRLNESGRKAANDSDYFRKLEGLNAESPTGRLAVRALAAFGPRPLADLQAQERRVYSTRPNRMQRPIPFPLKPILDQYQKEQATYAVALRKRFDAETLKNYLIGAMQATEPAPPARVLLAVSREGFGTGFELEMLLIDDQDKITQRSRATLAIPGANRIMPPEAKEAKDEPIPLNPTSQALIAAFRSLQTGQAPKIEGDLLKELEHPEEYDPMSFVIPDGLHAVAAGRNVVAQVEDIAFFSAAALADAQGKIGRNRFRGWLQAGHDLRPSDGWLVVAPKQAWDARETRIDRAHLGRFYRTARAEGGVNLDQAAAYALGCPRRYQETISFVYSFLLEPQVNTAIEPDNIEFLRIYAALDARQRQALAQGQKEFAFAELPVPAHEELVRLVFRDDAPLQRTYRSDQIDLNRAALDEPTEAMPNGLPADGTLSGWLQEEPAVIGQVEAGGSGAHAYKPMRAWDLAWNLAMNEAGTHPNDTVRHSKYRLGTVGNLQLDAKFSPVLGVSKKLQQSHFAANAPWVAFEQLPASFRDAVTKHLPEARKMVAEMKQREGTNKVPPP